MAKVSVIIPSHNYGDYVGRCLQSALSQEGFADFEVILIDDASTDHTRDVLKSFTDPRLRIIHHDANQGHLATVNKGFSVAGGEYLARMDADDYWHPSFLRQTVPILDKYPEAGLVHVNYAVVGPKENGTPSVGSRLPVAVGVVNELPSLLFHNYLAPHGVLFRKECLALIGGAYPLDLPFAEDWNLWLAIGKQHSFFFHDEVLAYYRFHERNFHMKLARAGEKERCELSILEHFFADPRLSADLRRIKPQVFGARYMELSLAYLGLGMLSDSRRCALQALQKKAA